jgi:hypothetical protein
LFHFYWCRSFLSFPLAAWTPFPSSLFRHLLFCRSFQSHWRRIMTNLSRTSAMINRSFHPFLAEERIGSGKETTG